MITAEDVTPFHSRRWPFHSRRCHSISQQKMTLSQQKMSLHFTAEDDPFTAEDVTPFHSRRWPFHSRRCHSISPEGGGYLLLANSPPLLPPAAISLRLRAEHAWGKHTLRSRFRGGLRHLPALAHATRASACAQALKGVLFLFLFLLSRTTRAIARRAWRAAWEGKTPQQIW